MSTIGDDLLRASLARVRAEDRGGHRLQLQPGGGRARVAQGACGLRARGPVHRGARALPDRHRRLRRHPAAGHDPARARRRPLVVRPPVHDGQQRRRSRRWARRSRTPRSSACWPRAWASTTPASPRPTTRLAAAGLRQGRPARRAFRLGVAEAAAAGSELGHAGRAVRRRRLPDAVGQVRVLLGAACWPTGSIRCPTYIPPYESAASNPELARRYPLAMISPPARNFLNSTFVNVTEPARHRRRAAPRHASGRLPRRAASPTATGCASSTTAAPSCARRA